MGIDEWTGAWDYNALASNIQIGRDCFLENPDVFRHMRGVREPAVVLGDRVCVYNWTAFSVDPAGQVEVGDDSILVGAVFWCADRITVGKRVTISYNVMIADSDFHPRDPTQRRRDAIAIAPQGDISTRPPLSTRPVVIEDDVQIGIGAIILKGVRIGTGARIGAGTVVTASVPAGTEVWGNPARPGIAEGNP